MPVSTASTITHPPARPRAVPATSIPLLAKSGPGDIKGESIAIHDIVQEWGEQSFPASDPPSNW